MKASEKKLKTDWKLMAKISGFIMLAGMLSSGLTYYQKRYLTFSPLIPESVWIQIAEPYLVATIAFTIASIAAWTLYYFSRYKLAVFIGAITIIFNYVNMNFILESWDF